MLEISDRIDWYSWLAAVSCELLSVPLEASVASVTARLSRVVTCERAPSATCRRPTPSEALVTDCVSAVWLASRPSTNERPAASSAPELILDPEDNCCSVFERLLLVLVRLFSAYTAERLFKTPRDMGFSLLDAVICGSNSGCASLCMALGCCSRSGADASGPYFGTVLTDFTDVSFVSRGGTVLLHLFSFFNVWRLSPITGAKEIAR